MTEPISIVISTPIQSGDPKTDVLSQSLIVRQHTGQKTTIMLKGIKLGTKSEAIYNVLMSQLANFLLKNFITLRMRCTYD